MSKLKPIKTAALTSVPSHGAKIELVGWPRGDRKKYGAPYLRLEMDHGVYLGTVKDRDVRRLKLWCDRIIKELKR